MSSVLMVRLGEKQTGPVPASGVHAELLEEMRVTATTLLKFLELERSGVYDGMGAKFLGGHGFRGDQAQKLVELAEQRTAELRDAGPR